MFFFETTARSCSGKEYGSCQRGVSKINSWFAVEVFPKKLLVVWCHHLMQDVAPSSLYHISSFLTMNSFPNWNHNSSLTVCPKACKVHEVPVPTSESTMKIHQTTPKLACGWWAIPNKRNPEHHPFLREGKHTTANQFPYDHTHILQGISWFLVVSY